MMDRAVSGDVVVFVLLEPLLCAFIGSPLLACDQRCVAWSLAKMAHRRDVCPRKSTRLGMSCLIPRTSVIELLSVRGSVVRIVCLLKLSVTSRGTANQHQRNVVGPIVRRETELSKHVLQALPVDGV